MTKIKLEGLKPDTDYFAQVRALLPEKQFSEWSLRFEFTTISDQSVPKTPTNITWTPSDRFYRAQYDTVTKNVDETDAEILRYEVEISNGGQTHVISTNPDSGSIQKWRISSEDLRVRFGNIPSQVGFRVRAVNFSEKASAWSSLITASIGAPNPPTNAVVTEIESGIKVEWTPPVDKTNVLGYRVYVDTNPSFVPSASNRFYEGPATNYTYNTLTFQLHYFKIRSYSEYGVESTDLLAQGTPKSPFEPDTTPPVVPGGLTVVAVGTPPNKSAKVSWTFDATGNNQDVHQFVIRWRKVGETDWNMDFASKEARTLTIPLPQPFANYEFQIGVLDWVGNYSAYSSTVTLTQAIPGPPPQISGLTATGSLDGLSIKWGASSADDVINGGFYEVQIATDAGFSTGLLNYKTGNTYIDVNGLASDTTYYVRVRAVDVEGSSGSYSSTLTTATTSFPVTPLSDGVAPASSPAATVSGGIGYLFVNWTATTNADPVTYEVHISTTNNFTPSAGTKVAETSATNIILEKDAAGANLAYGTTYYVKLLSKDRDGAASAYGTQGSGSPVKGTIGDLTLTAGDVGAYTTTQTDNLVTTSANGKNKITYAPTAPVNETNTGILGDTWYVRQSTSPFQITAVYELTTAPSTWTQRKINGATLDNLDAGTVSTGLLNAARVQIGAASTYSSGYDPSTKETPDGAQAKADGARTNAVNDLKTLWGHPSNTTLIDGGDIYTNSIRAYSMAIADFTNYWPNQTFAYDSPNLGGTQNEAPPIGNARSLTGRDHVASGWSWPIKFGETWMIEYTAKAITGSAVLSAAIWQTGGNGNQPFLNLGNTGGGNSLVELADLGNGWKRYRKIFTVSMANGTTTPTTGQLYFQIEQASSGGGTNWNIADIVVRKRFGGELIVDGSVAATKITTGDLSAAIITLQAGGQIKTSNSEVIISNTGIQVSGANSSITASSLTTGTFAAGQALTVNGNMTIQGNTTIAASGYIQSNNYVANSTGFRLSAAGLDIFSGVISAALLKGGTVSSTDIRLGSDGILQVDSTGVIKSNNYSPGVSGWQLSSSGLDMPGLTISAGSVTGDTISGRNLTVTSGGSIQSSNYNVTNKTGFRIDNTQLTMYSGTVYGLSVQTDQLRSINGNFSINPSGQAKLIGAEISGNVVVGTSSSNYIQSGNYSASAGWRLTGDGNLYANQGSFRGDISGSTISGSDLVVGSTGAYHMLVKTGGEIHFKNGSSTIGRIQALSGGMYLSDGPGNSYFRVMSNGVEILGSLNILGQINMNSYGMTSLSFVNGPGSSGPEIRGNNVRINSLGLNAGSNGVGTRYVHCSDTGVLTSSTNVPSARELKSDIRDAVFDSDRIMSLTPRFYKFNGTPNEPRTGFIADEVQDAGLREYVGYEDRQNPNKPTGLFYQDLGVAHYAVTKEHHQEIKELKSRIEALESLVQQLLDS